MKALEECGLQSENGALLGQSTRTFIALLLHCWLGSLLSLLLSRLRNRRRGFGLRLATIMQSLVGLGDSLVEGLTLDLGDLQLKGSGLAGAIGTLLPNR